MLLAIDVGNSNIKIGTYQKESLVTTWRFNTFSYATENDLVKLLESIPLSSKIQSIVFCSVVPAMTGLLIKALKQCFAIEPYEIRTNQSSRINIQYEIPDALGTDRFVNAVGAYELYGGPTIIVDSGTAIKVDIITAEGSFIGGMICPGLAISHNELLQRTELLPKLPLKAEEGSIIGRSTQEAMQSGIYYGYAGTIDNLVKKAKSQLGEGKITVVGTGGLMTEVMKQTDQIDIRNDFLTLEGLRILHKQNHENPKQG